MINSISLKNFKCFKSQVTFPFNQINLLTGINGCGKSSALQPILLMRQSLEHSRSTSEIVFNGSCVELGTFSDVRNSLTSVSEAIELTFHFQQPEGFVNTHYSLKTEEDDDGVGVIDSVFITGNYDSNDFKQRIERREQDYVRCDVNPDGQVVDCDEHYWHDLLWDEIHDDNTLDFAARSVQFNNVHFVSADRIGPQDTYPKQSFAEFPNVGRRGEFASNILFRKRAESVTESLRLEQAETHTIPDQATAWLSYIFNGGMIDAISVEEANIMILRLNSKDSVRTYRPVNVGFGYSYALPIIVSGLIAQPGDILIVENPEAHLHPSAQSRITKFLAQVCASGVQVFIESHSEHILNGLRIAILDDVINADALNILYFSQNLVQNPSKIVVEDDEQATINNWPDGFFDQTDKDYRRLFGF